MAVFPVVRSPKINSLCPLPMGIKASITFIPVCKGTVTGARCIIPGASLSTGRRFSVEITPLLSKERPVASITLPNNSSPTGASKTLPVRNTSQPAFKFSLSSNKIIPTPSRSRLYAIPKRPPGNLTNSSACTLGKPTA